jgi:hypothetical protein
MAILKTISETSIKVLEKAKDKIQPEANISDPLQYLQYSVKNKAIIFVVSDFNNVSETALKTLIYLTKKCRVYCINVYDYIEEISPESGEYKVEYNGEKLVFNSSSKEFKRTYAQYFQKKRKALMLKRHLFLKTLRIT